MRLPRGWEQYLQLATRRVLDRVPERTLLLSWCEVLRLLCHNRRRLLGWLRDEDELPPVGERDVLVLFQQCRRRLLQQRLPAGQVPNLLVLQPPCLLLSDAS